MLHDECKTIVTKDFKIAAVISGCIFVDHAAILYRNKNTIDNFTNYNLARVTSKACCNQTKLDCCVQRLVQYIWWKRISDGRFYERNNIKLFIPNINVSLRSNKMRSRL